MSSIQRRPLEFLAIVLLVQFVMDITVILDIPVARQIIGFVYFTFIPGFVIIKLLKMKNLGLSEIIIFSVGLSVGFLLIIGLLINSLLPLINITKPLSSVPLIIIFNCVVIAGTVIAFLRRADIQMPNFRISRHSLSLLLLAAIPVLSIVGAMFDNIYQNNLVLLIMIILISLIYVIFVLSNKSLSNIYPLILLIISISLLLHYSLISNYVHGPDSWSEIFAIRNTQTASFWNSLGPYPSSTFFGRLNSMLSLTILPTIYSSALNMDSTWVYKIIYPLIYSLVPLVLYQIWRQYISKKYALIATFLFMAESFFYFGMTGLARQMIAELFFVLLLFVILKKDMKDIERILCFTLFSFGLVVSHYALAEIFLFFISVLFIVSLVINRFYGQKNIQIKATFVLLFFSIMFVWYLYTSNSSVFGSFTEFGQNVLNQFNDFFNPASRGQGVMAGLGLTAPETFLNSISRSFAYLTEAFIIIGFIGLIAKRIKTNYSLTYTILTSASVILLALLIIVPGLAATLTIGRFYHILLFFLAPLCILGSAVIAQLINKRRKETLSLVLLAIILTAYFLFQTGFVYSFTGNQNYSLSLNLKGFGAELSAQFAVVTEPEVTSAIWLSKHIDSSNSQIYAGYITPLVGYGGINTGQVWALSNITMPKTGDFVYLGSLNTKYGLVIDNNVWNYSDIYKSIISPANSIYSNGEAEIYKFTGPN